MKGKRGSSKTANRLQPPKKQAKKAAGTPPAAQPPQQRQLPQNQDQALFESAVKLDPVTHFGPEILRRIFIHLRTEDLFLGCAPVSKKWNEFVNGDDFWKELITREFGVERANLFFAKEGALQRLKGELIRSSVFRFSFYREHFGLDKPKAVTSLPGADLNDFITAIKSQQPAFFNENNDEFDLVKSSADSPGFWLWKVPSRIFEIMDTLKPPIVYESHYCYSLEDKEKIELLDSNLKPFPVKPRQEFESSLAYFSDYPVGVRYVKGCGNVLLFRIVFPSLCTILDQTHEMLFGVSPRAYDTSNPTFVLKRDPGHLNYKRVKHDRFYFTPFAAAIRGHTENGQELLSEFLRLGASFAPHAIEYAIGMNYLDTVKLFFQYGAQVDTKGHDGHPLLYHALAGHFSAKGVAKFLLSKGANINYADQDGTTLLMHVVKKGTTDAIRYAIQNGADVNSLNKKNQSALHFAMMSGEHPFSMARLRDLLGAGANVNVKFVNDDGSTSTALIEAVKKGKTDVVKALLDHGAHVNAEDSSGKMAFDYAGEKGFTKSQQLLAILRGS